MIYIIKYFIPIILLLDMLFAQDESIDEKNKTYNEDVTSIIENNLTTKFNLSTNEEKTQNDKIENIILNYNFKLLHTKKEREYSFNFVSCFGDNIKFGGIWEKYAVINFTPQMFIQPFNFLKIYANHNIACFIPLKEVKENFKALALQSLAILAVDNSIKFLSSSNHWVTEIITFVVKNLVINFFIKPSIKNTNKKIPILEYENYYYSVNIRF